MMDFSQRREEYGKEPLRRENLLTDPFLQAVMWIQEAAEAGIQDPTAMVLATATKDGLPSSRTVILKSLDQQGLGFYTYRGSRKVRELEENPRASVTFHWRELERQMQAEGAVEPLTPKEAAQNFGERPRGSQIAAAISQQDAPLPNRKQLEREWEEAENKFRGMDVPVPPSWVGYRLIPHRFDFWQGGKHRLHDRFVYLLREGRWEIQRLYP